MSQDSSAAPSPGRGPLNPALPYILFGAFISSCFIYGGLIASGVLRSPDAPPLLELPVPLPLLFGALSLMNLPLALVIGRSIPLDGIEAPYQLLSGITRKLVLQCAFFEAIAIYGLVGYMLGMAPVPSIVFVGAGLFCLLLLIPGLQNQMDRLRRLMRETSTSGGGTT